MQVGARSTAITLRNKDILLFSPIKPRQNVLDDLESNGFLKYLICPNIKHHLSASDYTKLYPESEVYGVPGLEKKKTDVHFAGVSHTITRVLD